MIFLVMTIGRRQRHRDVAVPANPGASSRACRASLTWSRLAMLPSATTSFAQRLDGVALEAIGALARVGELDQLDRARTDVDADQRRGLGLEQIQGRSKFFSEHGSLVRNANNLH